MGLFRSLGQNGFASRFLRRQRSESNTLEVIPVELTELRREVNIRFQGETVGNLWYELIPPIVRPFSSTNLDFAALAILTHAMQEHKDLHVVGPVTRSLLANLEEYQDAWVMWRSHRYRRAQVSADIVLEDGPPQVASKGLGSVLAFSGGLDSIYALIANQTKLLGLRSRTVATLAMLHGFDIPLENVKAFEIASEKAARMGDAFGAPLQRIRTNWRQWSPLWGMTFGIGLASALQHFSGDHNAALISGDKSYGHENIPWGTNSITNHLMSSATFPLIGVKYGATRTEKAQVVGQHPLARELVRVCWAGEDLSRNCGHCEKCVRTKLNFLGAGVGVVPALGALDLSDLATLSSRSPGGVDGLDEILAAQPGLPPDVYDALAPVAAREHAKYAPVS